MPKSANIPQALRDPHGGFRVGHLTDKMQRDSAERMERLIRSAVGSKEGKK